MSTLNLDVYMPVVILIALALLVAGGSLFLGSLIRPHNPNKLKETAYECGEEPVGSAWANFNVRFYVIALIFIIFDVEGALMFPVAAVFKRFNEIGLGGVLLGSIFTFVLILVAGLVYCWKKGDLDWVKSYSQAPTTFGKKD
ncbi:NADH-quinone oxidoreductase subunit A [Bacteriovorax sp. PP10]|uniref:NADH-quinone oxidoreductase subunit A n=1 Tax=Bacteriovorax antarcticus TaxID=3088717 RepID=A0ABU5VQS7_9BACT|nr:NADH-quinone oxidoreductase subunit A [Bacteriovorax sp. PP10]MEA9354773.1 NADH-quinone oxidoreductase subunit A [Bacteriovorax sp. PP10]